MVHKVVISKKAQKSLAKIPRHILIRFDLWVETIEVDSYKRMQSIKGFRDHSLVGNREGQRSSSLNRSWRIIYKLDKKTNEVIVEVLEVNHHEY